MPCHVSLRPCTAIEEMIALQAARSPRCGRDSVFMEQIQRNLHLFGRYGITMFAISALDIAPGTLPQKRRVYRCIG
jgi:hypothetical protein